MNDAAAALAKAGRPGERDRAAVTGARHDGRPEDAVSAFDGPRAHADEARRFPGLLSESLKKDKLEAGAQIDYATWVAARKLGETGRAAVDALFERHRRHPDRAGAGRGAAWPRTHGRGHVQPPLDLSLDALRDPAVDQGGRQACRSASSSSGASMRMRRLLDIAGLGEERCHEAAQRHQKPSPPSRPARSPPRNWCAAISTASPSATAS